MLSSARRSLHVLVMFVALLGVTMSAHAQTRPAAPAAAPAAATGRIAGRALEKGKDPVSFANVVVLGTKQGTMTDENGAFVIPGVPVGTYQVKLQAIGFDPVIQTVQVNAGQTATVTFSVGQTKVVKEVETIEVRAEKRIDTKSSTTKQTITAEKLKEIPVDNLSQAIATKAGIVAQGGELHFRGGRGGEVKFQFDGVEATDPAFGGQANIANLAVAGTDVLSGGFDAEYGNALSGVVSVSTKEGGDRLSGEVRWDTDRYGDPTKTFNDYDRFTFGFGGPTPIKNLTYFATYEGSFTDTYLSSSLTKPHRTLLDFIQLGNRQNNQVNSNFKLAYRINPKNKVTFETINNRTISTAYNHMWSRQGYVQVFYDTVRTAGQPDCLAVAVRQPHATDDRGLHVLVFGAFRPLRLATASRGTAGTAERAGRATAPSCSSTSFMISPSSLSLAASSPTVEVSLITAKAIATWPLSWSATPTTATSAMLAWACTASSISRVPRRCPATLITSSVRPRMKK